jgi:hypothetical protein
MTAPHRIRSRSSKLAFTGLALLVAALGGLLVLRIGQKTTAMPCSNDAGLGTIDGVCVTGYSLVSSYDALPVTNQREMFRLQGELPILNKGFVGSLDSQGQFRVAGKWIHRTEVIVDIEAAASFDYPERWPTVQKFLVEVKAPFYKEAKYKSPIDNKASCDPTNAWTLLKLHEESLRRCLRTMFLLDMTDTFNDRTQKLFENQTIKYSDGTTGPLSLKRKGLTDSDRSKVVAAVKAIDNKARALGGYH